MRTGLEAGQALPQRRLPPTLSLCPVSGPLSSRGTFCDPRGDSARWRRLPEAEWRLAEASRWAEGLVVEGIWSSHSSAHSSPDRHSRPDTGL